MSKPFYIELYDSITNNLINKFKFILGAKTVKEVKELIVEKLVNKNEIQKDDDLKIKDNDLYELGSDDEVQQVIPDGKLKLFLTNKALNVPQVNIPISQSPLVQTTSSVQPIPNLSQSSKTVSVSTQILDLKNLIIPVLNPTDKTVLKLICPQIRKSIIEIPIKQGILTFELFSEYVVCLLGLNKQLKAILFDQSGCPFVNNLDLLGKPFAKLDLSQVHYVLFTKTESALNHKISPLMECKASPQTIRITKASLVNPIDIKFQIDLSNTLNVLRYKIFELTQIHPSNQILKFGNSILANDLQTLNAFGIKQQSIVELQFKLNSNIVPSTACDKFYYKDVKLINEQSEIANQFLKANLIVLNQHILQQDSAKLCAALEKYTGDMPLVYAFQSMLRGSFLSQASKIALEEGLFTAILNFIKGLKTIPVIKVDEVFLYFRSFFGFILESRQKIANIQKVKSHFQSIILKNVCHFTLKPIKNPGMIKLDTLVHVIVDKESFEEQINKGLVFGQYQKPNKADIKQTAELSLAWHRFLDNHTDNEDFCTLFWFGYLSPNDNFNLADAHCDINTYTSKVDTYPNLQINNPMQLKNKVYCHLLLKTKQGRFRVFLSKNKNINKPFNLFDPTTGHEEACNLDLMSGAVNTQNTEVKIDKNDLKPVITRQPKQAIVVLFDISGSMGTKFFNQPDLSRMGAVKSFFQAFAYRTIAYNLEHVVSLIFFDDKIEVQCDFTEAIFDFNRLISEAHARGSTKLYDSIVLAANNLIGFSKKYSECKLRILALTDGEDNSSSNNYIEAAKILVNNKIIIDSFAVGTGCDGLKNITLASGGKCYLTRNLQESLKLFEQQTVLSVRVRSIDETQSSLSIQQLIKKAQLQPFDQVHSVHKFNLPQIKANKLTSQQLAKKLENEEEVKKMSGNNAMKRIAKQIQNYSLDPHPFVSIYPAEDLQYWKLLLVGPNNTPYENGVFILYAKFPNDYPFRPPEVRFITPIYHCNVNSQGRICHSVFDRNYSPALKFKNIIECIYGLILTPEPEDPLDNVIASFYLSDYQVYLKNSKEATAKNASTPPQQLVEQVYGNIQDDIEKQKKIKQIHEWIEQAKKHN